MNKKQLINYLNYPESLDDWSLKELQQIVEEYPFFHTAQLLYLKNLQNSEDINFPLRLKIASLYAIDRKKLFFLLNKKPKQKLLEISEIHEIIDKHASQTTVGNKQQEEQIKKSLQVLKEKSNEVILNSVLTKESLIKIIEQRIHEIHRQNELSEDEKNRQKKHIEDMHTPFSNIGFGVQNVDKELINEFRAKNRKKNLHTNYSVSEYRLPDYEEDDSPKTNKELIENFIKKYPKAIKKDVNKQKSASQELQEPEKETVSFVTETLAKIYIKQQLFDKAIQAYQKLSLKYPEKSIYFAAQIENIERLKSE